MPSRLAGRVEEGRIETAGIFDRDADGDLRRGDGMPPGEERFERAGFDVRALLADRRSLPADASPAASPAPRGAVAGPWAGTAAGGSARAAASPWAIR